VRGQIYQTGILVFILQEGLWFYFEIQTFVTFPDHIAPPHPDSFLYQVCTSFPMNKMEGL
jgi:hypothetical protein